MSRHGIFQPVSLTATPKMILPPSTARKAILFPTFSSTVAGAFYTVSTDPGVASGIGINVFPNVEGPVLIDFATFGDVVQHAWYGVASSGATFQLGLLEAFDD